MEMIVAVDERGGIAKDGQIPWLGQFPEDMKFFKETTMGHAVFMGRTTFFSLPPRFRPLPYRTNIVYTRTPEHYDNSSDPSVSLVFSNEGPDNHTNISKNRKIFIIGGSQIYNKFYYQCNTIWVTRIQDDYQCDTFLDINKILDNYWLAEIVLQGKGFVIEKYIRCVGFTGTSGKRPHRGLYPCGAVKPSSSVDVDELRQRIPFGNSRLAPSERDPYGVSTLVVPDSSKSMDDGVKRTESRSMGAVGSQSIAKLGNPTTNGIHKLLQMTPHSLRHLLGTKVSFRLRLHETFQSFPLLTNIFSRTTKRIHHKNNEDT